MKKYTLLTILLLISQQGFSQSSFQGVGGVFYKGTTGVPTKSAIFDLDRINGITVLFKWEDVEPIPGNFDWSYVDEEIAKAVNTDKKISLLPIGSPGWMTDLNVQTYYYLDENPYHPTYGDILSSAVPWDSIYVERYKNFLGNLANKYADDSIVCYVNTVAGPFSRGMPDSVVIDTVSKEKTAFYDTFDYNADTLARIEIEMIDLYMDLFPNTPLWFSVDFIKFEPFASGRDRNYLANLCLDYGIENYPGRFGLFREDIQPCNPKLDNLFEGSHWYLMVQNPCRTGGQMLWSVQDGPTRMNKCGIAPNTKQVVLDSAINMALALGMRYVEVYGIDISDTSLTPNIIRANELLKAMGDSCMLKQADTMYELTVNNGTGSGDYEEGVIVNIVADAAIATKEFDRWIGDVSLLSSDTVFATSFTMPDSAVSLTATYKDIEKIDAISDNKLIFEVYPNPASNLVNISTNVTIEKIQLVNILGKVVLENTLNSQQSEVNISQIPSGVYFMNIKMEDNTRQIVRFIKK